MPTEDTKADIGFGPTMMPVTDLPAGVKAAYSSGPDIRGTRGRTVAYALRVRGNMRVGDREFSADINMHEVVPMRRYYEELGGGSIALEPGWKPGLDRLVPLDQQELQVELSRMLTAFQVPRQNSLYQILPLYYGTEPSEQLRRLHEVMRRQMEAWAALVATARTRIPMKEMASLKGDEARILAVACDHITAKELEEVANIADPSYNGADQIELPEVLRPTSGSTLAPAYKAPDSDTVPTLAEVEAAVNAEEQGEDPTLKLIEKLKGVGCDESQALQLASLVELAGDAGALADDDIVKTLGSKAKLAAVRRALKQA